jgi:hypothetical protein
VGEINIYFFLENMKKRPLERPKSRWEDIKTHLKRAGYKVLDWIYPVPG